ncbi:hypothetical protein DENSPDRAFT_684050 [Dentipellis sp. KUC8613]|nr:hypothetical protein DENSPDRAFT_684050 [Dentipellis sp. KUC8613]
MCKKCEKGDTEQIIRRMKQGEEKRAMATIGDDRRKGHYAGEIDTGMGTMQTAEHVCIQLFSCIRCKSRLRVSAVVIFSVFFFFVFIHRLLELEEGVGESNRVYCAKWRSKYAPSLTAHDIHSDVP